MPTGRKETTNPDGAANALRKDDLIVGGRERCHHQSKNVHKRAEDEEPSWPVFVIYPANNEALRYIRSALRRCPWSCLLVKLHHQRE